MLQQVCLVHGLKEWLTDGAGEWWHTSWLMWMMHDGCPVLVDCGNEGADGGWPLSKGFRKCPEHEVCLGMTQTEF
jgi:hypothetical protein